MRISNNPASSLTTTIKDPGLISSNKPGLRGLELVNPLIKSGSRFTPFNNLVLKTN